MDRFLRQEIRVPCDSSLLAGVLVVPEKSARLVIFAHGGKSGRLSPRNQYIAKELNKNNCATLLVDLLTVMEDETEENQFNIALLTKRLLLIIKQIQTMEETKRLSIGIFGTNTGAAAALDAASLSGMNVRAVVSGSGRSDLAREDLSSIPASALFIVGGRDEETMALNRATIPLMTKAESATLKVIPGATNLFDEKDALEATAKEATRWFQLYL
ncbi:MAG: alpha/beta hydrolase [Candidatus Paceibacterota bacterium]|jgi:dienelactone hydrolase